MPKLANFELRFAPELKQPCPALNSGGNITMSRRELAKSLRTIARASGRQWDGPTFSSTSSNIWPQQGSSIGCDRFYGSRTTTPRGSATPDYSNDTLKAPLNSKLIDRTREKQEEKMRVNGFPKGRAREKAFLLNSRKTAGVPSIIPVQSSFDEADRISTGGAHDVSSSNGAFSASSSTSNGSPSSYSSSHHDAPSFAASGASSSSSSNPAAVISLHTSAESSMSAAGVLASSDDEDFSLEVSDEVVATVYKNELPPDVFVVNDLETAKKIAARLTSPELADRTFACDTEVMDIDVAKHSPCCHGTVTCFSIYCGPDVDFSIDNNSQNGGPPRSMLWVDTYLDGDESKTEEVQAIIEVFRPFWEAKSIRKVWHNYSFDRHVMERFGISMAGFDGDTMHMARLWDSSRIGKGGYSLEALSSDEKLMGPTSEGDIRGKISMKKLFGRRNIKKDGTEGKLTVLPAVHDLQRNEDTKWQWINYSAYDAKSTWDLYKALEAQLRAEPAKLDNAVNAAYARSGIKIETLWDLYREVWRPFGEILTEMEAAGMAVDRSHLAAAEERAVKEEEEAKERFKNWAASKVADAKYMNVGSGPQVTQLLFGGRRNRAENKPGVPMERVFKVPNQLPPEEGKKAKKNMDIALHNVWNNSEPSPVEPEIYTPSGLPACSTPVLKALAGKPGRARKALQELQSASTSKPSDSNGADADVVAVREDFDEVWSTDDAEIAKLQKGRQELQKSRDAAEMAAIAQSSGYGTLFKHFPTLEEGLRACAAVDSLIDASAIDTLLSNFIVPLQSDDISKPDSNGVYRVHCSLNINTETGRLSARRPNLQNQPALEKDRYKVRKAFTADRAAGKTLIVADYGQLELRILAHMASCESMLTAFKLGGDFHSRTALGMYDHIQDAVSRGDCLLEWDGTGPDGAYTVPPAPLLKDLFGAERRKAKVLNFSIAYGKTAHGLSKDWGVSLKEAEDTVKRWYSDRPEVRAWQDVQYEMAEQLGYVCTILGRRRQLPDARSKNKAAKAHALRAAINTPIQGSAADVATAAMLRINADSRLKEMGWRLLLQVHDEVILEGPKETAEAAQAVVVECMRSPFGDAGGDPLRVELAVDSKFADTWYDAK